MSRIYIFPALYCVIAIVGCMAGPEQKNSRFKDPVTHDDDHKAHDDHQDMERMNGSGAGWPSSIKLMLSWDKVDHEGLLGYRIYLTSTTIKTPTQLKEVYLESQSSLNPELPSVQLSVEESSTLTELVGEKVCFLVTAISDAGESETSERSCIQLEAPL